MRDVFQVIQGPHLAGILEVVEEFPAGGPQLADEFPPVFLFLPHIDHHHLDVHIIKIAPQFLERLEFFLALLAVDQVEEDQGAEVLVVIQGHVLAALVLQLQHRGLLAGRVQPGFREVQDDPVHEFLRPAVRLADDIFFRQVKRSLLFGETVASAEIVEQLEENLAAQGRLAFRPLAEGIDDAFHVFDRQRFKGAEEIVEQLLVLEDQCLVEAQHLGKRLAVEAASPDDVLAVKQEQHRRGEHSIFLMVSGGRFGIPEVDDADGRIGQAAEGFGDIFLPGFPV